MAEKHSLLRRQLKKFFGSLENVPEEWQDFIDAINEAYRQSDSDRNMLERSLDLSSHELLQTNAEMRAVFHAFPDLFFWINYEGKILDCKGGSEEDLYFSREKLIGKNIYDVPDQEISNKLQEVLEELKETKAMVRVEYSLKKDNREYFYESRLLPLSGDQIIMIVRNITERKQAEEALRDSEIKSRSLLEGSPVCNKIIDLDSRLQYMSAAGLKMLKITDIQPFYGQIYPSKNYPEWMRAPLVEHLERAMAGEICSVESALFDTEGSRVWLHTTFVPARDDEGRIEYIIVSSINITERKKAEEVLKESEEKYRSMFVNMLNGFAYHKIVLNDNGNPIDYIYLEVNEKFEEYTGLKRDNVIGKRVTEVIPGIADADPNMISIFGKVAITGESTQLEIYFEPLNRYYSISSYSPQKGYFVALFQDITERKHAEEEILRILKAVESSSDAIGMSDPQGHHFYQNKAFNDLFEYSSAEELEAAGGGIVAYVDNNIAKEVFNHIMSGQSWIGEVEMVSKNGHRFPVLLRADAVKDDKGNIIGLIGVHTDITERKLVEKALLKAKEAAEEANCAKSDFLANMSHEIRTPMNGIIGMTELALDTELTPEQRNFLGMVKMSADSLLVLLNDILDYSKIEAGKLDIDPIKFNLFDSISETMSSLALRAEEKGLELICHVLPDVPSSLVGDPGRIRQIIVNLIGNAIKFTEKGEIILRVEKDSQTTDKIFLRFQIIDTGVGIPVDKQQLIFDAFSQADSSTTRKFGGTGLGLSISSQLVKMMGGEIGLESEMGKGSMFQFTVGLGLSADPTEKQIPLDTNILKEMPVLVVDDNATNRFIMQETLTNWHMKPTVVESGQAALSAMEQTCQTGTPFPLVILDFHMPEMDGFVLAKRIRENPLFSEVKIIMLSSVGRRGEAARCEELKLGGYLTKPVIQSELMDTIATVFSKPLAESQTTLVTRHSIKENRRHLQILLVEDNLVNQKLATHMLEKRGYVVAVANNGKEALAALEKDSFDIVLMDIQMPEMDGFATTAAIREKEKETKKHLPIIAMTAHAMKGDREKCLEMGMDNYVSKPIKANELFEIIEGLLASSTEKKYGKICDCAA